MRKLNQMLELRKANAELLFEGLKGFEQNGILKLPKEPENNKFNWYLFTVGFKENSHRELVKNSLLKVGIGATVYYDPPVHKTPYYDDTENKSESNADLLPNTTWAWNHVLSLPVHPLMDKNDLNTIVKTFENSL
jgi:dTDP-4-amino-4,6-dideoxygalactose transaminase